MKKVVVFIFSLLIYLSSFANHIAGGELFYEYQGPGTAANTARYKLTMRLFRDCASSGQTLETESVVIGIYNTNDGTLQSSARLKLQLPTNTIKLNTNAIPCLTNAPSVCFQIGIFTSTVDLPLTAAGYTLTWIRCCRVDFIENLSIPSNIGATFTTSIPGTSLISNGSNSSPQFAIKDTALVCKLKNFVLDFGATDPDADSLSYAFCSAYGGGTPSNPNPGNSDGGPPTQLSLSAISYKSPFSGIDPLGSSVTINPRTGKITGKAPDQGRYVINVCVTEWRKGVRINEHRKDFILQVGNCDYAGADPLPLAGAWCKDFKVNFSNNSTSATIQSYSWDFGVPNATDDVSDQPTPDYTYKDTGVYTITLVVRGSAGCVDTGRTTVGVYPGFKADFDVIGSCYKTPFIFKDKTQASFGQISSWSWDFGDLASSSDVSSQQNPTYKFPDPGTRNTKLVVTSSKGCVDSIVKPSIVRDAALVNLAFKDTLICSIDTLRLAADGIGTFNWTPNYNITDPTSATPGVFPKDTTTYFVTFTDVNGCVNKDSVRVNVLDSISVYAGADTTICGTDTMQFHPVSYGLQYQWTPTTGILGNPNTKNPTVRPDATTNYTVTARLGKCLATDALNVRVVPYPKANAGQDAIICYGKSTPLTGTIAGSSFSWSPINSLANANTLSPTAGPMSTTAYVLTVRDTVGCGKPSRDTVLVTVIPPVKAFAGNDTTIVANQPLQLNATGGTNYLWSPATGMSNPAIANPSVVLGPSYDSVTYMVRVGVQGGCFADDEMTVRIFKTGPDLFIPTAFTPNGDGRNDYLKPVAVGVKNISYFRVYNRWGQMLYSTTSTNEGWDGTYGGKAQPTATYVYMAEATDYLGKTIVKKGTVLLIR